MGRIKTLLGLVIVAGIIIYCVMFVPVYFNNYQFQDEVVSLAKFGGDRSELSLRADIMKKAVEHSIPIMENDVVISRANGVTSVEIEYDVTIDLQVKQYVLHFSVLAPPHSP